MSTKVGITLSASDETKSAFDSVNRSLGDLAAKNQSILQGIGGFGGGLVGGMLGVDFAAKLKDAVTGTYAFAASLDDMSESTGASVENLSALVGVAKIGGHDLGAMESGLQKLAKALHSTDEETKGAGKALAAIGLSLDDLAKLDTGEAMLKVAQSLGEFENGSAKTAVAIALLGKNGAELLPFLNDLSEKSSLVGKVTTEQAAMAERYEKNLNKLSAGFGVVGKTIALEMLPFMVKLTDEATKAKDSTGGFAEMLGGGVRNVLETVAVLGVNTAYVFKAIGTEIGGIAAQAAALMSGDFQGAAAIGKMMKEDAALARKEVDELTARILDRSKDGAAIIAEQRKKLKFTAGNDPKPKKDGKDAQASAEATAYGKSMEQLANLTRDADAAQLSLTKSQKALFDLMSSAEWQTMPEAWRETAVAQFEQAYAAEQAAESSKRLNEMLAKTDSAEIEKVRKDMELLAKAFEDGKISAQQFTEAAEAELGRLDDKAKKSSDKFEMVISNAFENAGSALADFVMGGKADFGGLVNSMIRDLLRLEYQMQMTSLYKEAGGLSGILGGIKGLFSGSSSSSATGLASLPSSVLPSFDVGTDYVPRDMIAQIHKGERIVPAKFNPAIGNGGASSITVNIIESSEKAGQVETRKNEAGMDVDVYVQQALAKDMRNNGPITRGFASTFNLRRAV